MANKSDGRKFWPSGHPSDRVWMESSRTRPVWGEKGKRSMRDSGIGSIGSGYGLVPGQTGRRKRHAEDESLGGGYAEVKRNSLESQDLESISSESDSQEVTPGWPPDDICEDLKQCKQSFSERSVRGSSCLVQRSGQDYKVAKGSGGGKGRITLFTGPTG